MRKIQVPYNQGRKKGPYEGSMIQVRKNLEDMIQVPYHQDGKIMVLTF